MFQTIGDKRLYVVDLDEMPQLPITGLTEEETLYERLLDRLVGNRYGTLLGRKTISPYAIALTESIKSGLITEPGKYGIEILWIGRDNPIQKWNVYRITEEDD